MNLEKGVAMKTKALLFISLILVVFFTACDPANNDPLHAELRLVPLTTGELAKAVQGEGGQLYYAASELPALLAKTASADIDFGEMNATKTLQYVLMNVGNTDVYDITFASQDLVISPAHIGLVPTPGEGGDLIALPIISVIKEHVVPLDGVGSLLDMSVGAFNDLLTLSHNYNITDTAGTDSFDITDEYLVAGTKMGALIDIRASGHPIQDVMQGSLERYALYGFIDPFYNLSVSSDMLDTLMIYNNGNAPLPIQVVNPYAYRASGLAVLDTVLNEGGVLDLSGIVRGEQYLGGDQDLSHGSIIFLGADLNQPYIFEILGNICTDGKDGILFTEY